MEDCLAEDLYAGTTLYYNPYFGQRIRVQCMKVQQLQPAADASLEQPVEEMSPGTLLKKVKQLQAKIKVVEAPLLDDDGLITKGYNFRNIIGHPAQKTVVLSLT